MRAILADWSLCEGRRILSSHDAELILRSSVLTVHLRGAFNPAERDPQRGSRWLVTEETAKRQRGGTCLYSVDCNDLGPGYSTSG